MIPEKVASPKIPSRVFVITRRQTCAKFSTPSQHHRTAHRDPTRHRPRSQARRPRCTVCWDCPGLQHTVTDPSVSFHFGTEVERHTHLGRRPIRQNPLCEPRQRGGRILETCQGESTRDQQGVIYRLGEDILECSPLRY